MENFDDIPVESGTEEIMTVSGNDAGGSTAPVMLFDSTQTYDAVYNAVNDAIVANQVVTDGQAIPSTALEYFKGVLANEMPFTDYVIYCGEPYQYTYYDGQRTAYEYCMAYGDLECSGDYFSGTADIVKIRSVGEYAVTYTNNQVISLVAPQYYSRSNLGNYSGVITYDYIGLATLVLLGIGGIICFLDKIFGFRWH